MSGHLRPDELLRELGRAIAPVEPAEQRARLRERVARNVETTVTQEVERRHAAARWRTRAVTLAVAAAIVLVPVGWWQWSSRTAVTASLPALQSRGARLQPLAGSVNVTRADHAVRLVAREIRLSAGDRIVTGQDGRARLTLESGVVAGLSSQTVLGLPGGGGRLGEQVDLTSGSVDFTVPKLRAGDRLQVLTPHALVEVRGTRFVVKVGRVNPGAGLVSTVRVKEGLVAVTASGLTTLLHAGEQWSSGPNTVASDLAEETPDRAQVQAGEDATGSANGVAVRDSKTALEELRGVAGAAAVARYSTLGAETRLFEQAMALQRSGQHATALARFERFLSVFPESPLAQEAQVQRFRLLKRLGQDQAAASAARQYMAEHPRGFARGEAKQLALPPPEASGRP